MRKDTNFSGNSVFGQLISLIPSSIVSDAVQKTGSNRYTKKFTTWEHLVTMLFSSASNTVSLRDVSNGLAGLEGKLKHLNIKNPVSKSTLSDANKNRKHEVFEIIYYNLLKFYEPILSDSRFKVDFGKELSIIDSTTIGLFKDIMKCTGRIPKRGKQKGGVKVHMQIRADYNTPILVKITDATTHDSQFMNFINFQKDQIYVFDRGFNDYLRFEQFVENEIPFVTRLKHNASFVKKEEFELSENTPQDILLDEKIQIPIRLNGRIDRYLELRRIVYWDEINEVCYEFITNIYDLEPEKIAQIYKCRWIIELLFKQLKQNQPLQYFLGDNENAITIQIWCSLIWNLLMTVLQRQIKLKKWAFSNLISVVRIHLFNYINIRKFLENPEKYYATENVETPDLFNTS
jgi:hypothetical protein